MKYFILMADIIKSSEKKAPKMMAHFSEMVEQVNHQYAGNLLSPLTITLGDEFQGVVKGIADAISVIFKLDYLLLSATEPYKLRYVVNYGNIDTPLNPERAHRMLGPGLTEAREYLDRMKKEKVSVSVLGLQQSKQHKLNLAFMLYRSLYDDWHVKDRKVAAAFIENGDYKVQAKRFQKDPSSMWRKRKSLKIEEYHAVKELINELADE